MKREGKVDDFCRYLEEFKSPEIETTILLNAVRAVRRQIRIISAMPVGTELH